MSSWASQVHAFHQPVCQRLSWLHHWSVPHVHTIGIFSPSEWGPDPQCQAAQVAHWTWWWQCLAAWHCRSVWSEKKKNIWMLSAAVMIGTLRVRFLVTLTSFSRIMVWWPWPHFQGLGFWWLWRRFHHQGQESLAYLSSISITNLQILTKFTWLYYWDRSKVG